MKRQFAFIFSLLTVSGSQIISGSAAQADSDHTFSGNASWYGVPFHGKKTASGEIFDMNKLSAAHKTLPFVTKVMVENPKTGKSAVIRVNDRGPFVRTRVMDLSRAGAKELGYLDHGTAYLDFTVLHKSTKSAESHDKSSSSSETEKETKSSEK